MGPATCPDRQGASRVPRGWGRTEAIFVSRRRAPASDHERLEWTFLRWAWGAGYLRWEDGLRGLARALRGLEAAGLITRHTVRRPGEPPLHGIVLTDDAHAALVALSDTAEGGAR